MNNSSKTNSKGRWLRDNAPVFTGIGTISLVIVGAVGLFLVISELKELRRQNSFIESNLRQTYRPVGFACFNPDDPEMVIVDILHTEETLDRFSFRITYYLYNHGRGVLSYIGCFFLSTPDPVDFRAGLLNGDLDSVNVDSRYSFVRRETILPFAESSVSRTATTALFLDVPFAERYFVYTLFLYEDQEGNLYDTEHLNVLPFQKPKIEGELVITKLDRTKPSQSRETYHYYSQKERRKLVAAIKALKHPKDHPMADFIEGLK